MRVRHRRDSHRPFGSDRFGVLAERFARFFGTPRFIIGQTVFVVAWITINSVHGWLEWDHFPYILLNLGFSTQAAYAAPLILLAQTRQADRDGVQSRIDAQGQREIMDEITKANKRIEALGELIYEQQLRNED